MKPVLTYRLQPRVFSYFLLFKKLIYYTMFMVYFRFKIKLDFQLAVLLFWARLSQLTVCCMFRHVSDGLVSLHAFFPLLTIKPLHCDTPHTTWIQTVRGNAVSIRVGAWSVETLNPTCLTEGVLSSVCVKCVCGQIFRPL